MKGGLKKIPFFILRTIIKVFMLKTLLLNASTTDKLVTD
jgi:hypothetical protein